MASSRISPLDAGMAKRAPHEEQLSQMHDALYQLGDQARPASPGSGSQLLPSPLAPGDKPEAVLAKKHISKLHKAFKNLKRSK